MTDKERELIKRLESNVVKKIYHDGQLYPAHLIIETDKPSPIINIKPLNKIDIHPLSVDKITEKVKEHNQEMEKANKETEKTVDAFAYPNKEYEMVNHPSHYNSSSIETIEKMRRIWGNEATALWCEMTAFKYRDRIGNKPNNSNDQEVGKIKWYENKAKELRNIG